MRDYKLLEKGDYFELTKFPQRASVGLAEISEREREGYNFCLWKISITRELMFRIFDFLVREGLITRVGHGDFNIHIHTEKSIEAAMARGSQQSFFTANFGLHFIGGKRGGWYILDYEGRMPPIPNEFVDFGPMRKSRLGRKWRYRRQLTRQEESLESRLISDTPSFVQLYSMILKKYSVDIRNVSFDFRKDLIHADELKNPFG